jgi:hypothetical protein
MAENVRGDVRLMLLRRGWHDDAELGYRLLRKGDRLLWAAVNTSGESELEYDDGDRRWVARFEADVPARVVVAACETAATIA